MVESADSENSEYSKFGGSNDSGESDSRISKPEVSPPGKRANKRKDANAKTQKAPPQIVWDKFQQDFLDTEGDKILCCGRQIGKSEMCGADAALYIVAHPHENVLMIAICDTEKDFGPESEVPAALKDQSSFNLGQLDLLYADYSRDFSEIEDTIE